MELPKLAGFCQASSLGLVGKLRQNSAIFETPILSYGSWKKVVFTINFLNYMDFKIIIKLPNYQVSRNEHFAYYMQFVFKIWLFTWYIIL